MSEKPTLREARQEARNQALAARSMGDVLDVQMLDPSPTRADGEAGAVTARVDLEAMVAEALVDAQPDPPGTWGTWSTNFQRNRQRWAPGDLDLRGKSVETLHDRMRKWWAVGVHVGAGPSLDRNLGVLRKVYRRGDPLPRPGENRCALIFASDAALKPMLAAGIVPDYVVALDEHQATLAFYDGIEQGGMTLLASITALPDSIAAFLKGWKGGRNRVLFWGNDNDNVRPPSEQGNGRHFFGLRPECYPQIPWFRALDPAVTLMGVEIAGYMGLRHHFLMGCDFQATPGAAGHCRGFAVDHTGFMVDSAKPELGKITPEVYADRVTRSMATHLRRLHAIPNRLGLPIYNCTEGGALDFNNLPLLEAAKRFGFLREDA